MTVSDSDRVTVGSVRDRRLMLSGRTDNVLCPGPLRAKRAPNEALPENCPGLVRDGSIADRKDVELGPQFTQRDERSRENNGRKRNIRKVVRTELAQRMDSVKAWNGRSVHGIRTKDRRSTEGAWTE